MANHVFLSLWLEADNELSLAPLEQSLRLIPQSKQRSGIQQVTVTPLDWGQPPVRQEQFTPGAEIAQAVAVLAECAHDDYAFEAECHWDLWVPAEPERPGVPVVPAWRQIASPVRVCLLGRQFDRLAEEPPEPREEGDLQVDFGPEELFLAPDQPLNAETRAKLQQNIAALVGVSNALAAVLRPRRRHMWSEGEDDLASRLTARLQWVQ